MSKLIPLGRIESKIFYIRGKRVMLDKDLAELYDVPTKQLTRQVRRNSERFPEDFMFKLTKDDILRCQFGTSRYGGRRYPPYVFTQEGVAMLSSVLNSRRAILVNTIGDGFIFLLYTLWINMNPSPIFASRRQDEMKIS